MRGKLNRLRGESMFKHWIEILHDHDSGYLIRLFSQNAFPLRESVSASILERLRMRTKTRIE